MAKSSSETVVKQTCYAHILGWECRNDEQDIENNRGAIFHIGILRDRHTGLVAYLGQGLDGRALALDDT